MSEHERNDSPGTIGKRTSRKRRIWTWIAAVLGVVGIGAVTILFVLAHRAEPILRKRVIETLSARFHSPVELDEFHILASHGLGVSGKGLRVMYIVKTTEAGKQREEPMLEVGTFEFRTTLRGLWHSPTHIGDVHVQGLRVHLPPKEERAPIMPRDAVYSKGANAKQTAKEPKESLLVDRIIVDDAVLVMETNKPDKDPLEFDIQKVVLHDVGRTRPFDFDAVLVNPKPVGNIHSTGHFGPWNADDPRQTSLDGQYSFTDVDMDSIKGIGGHMTAHGTYGGVLEEISSDGETDMKDFSLDVSDHPVPLHTKYHATIDGTSGDVILDPVEATMLHSHFICRGHVVRAKGRKGHDIALDVDMPNARIEDMLNIAVKQRPVLMTGGFRMKTHLHIPPGDVSVSRKIELSGGRFTITNAVFNEPKIQDKIEMLSERAQGHADKANMASKEDVTSTMQGSFNVQHSKISVSQLLYTMPGAQVVTQGEYGMTGSLFEFHGKIRTKAKVSQMTTGWKSLLLKPVDPFFKHHNAGAEIPFKVSGTKDEPHFGPEFRQKDQNKIDTSNMPAPK